MGGWVTEEEVEGEEFKDFYFIWFWFLCCFDVFWILCG